MTKKTKGKANVSGNRRADGKNKKPKQQQLSAATVRRLKMYKVRPKHHRKGKLISNEFQSKQLLANTRIQPDPRWFGNTRVVSQQQLSLFREELEKKKHMSNGYNVILKHKTLPTLLFT